MENATIDWTLGGINNKLRLQEQILDRFETDTNHVIVDPNTPACELIECFCSTSAGIVKSLEDIVRPAIYPARANSVSDLYKHLSDYDYVDLFASPSSTVVTLVVDKNYIIAHSVGYDSTNPNLKKLTIPKETKITVGDHAFGLYYPISIKSNASTGRFTVVYETAEKNPLRSLSTNVLDYEIKKNGDQDLVFIKIPVYQFEVRSFDNVLVNGTGFNKSIAYENQFYAIRARAEVLQNPGHDDDEEDVWKLQELSLCVGGQSYDPNEPTLVFTPDMENNRCYCEIPYVYFSNGLVRGTLKIDLYTTEGAISYAIPADTNEACSIDMFSRLTDEEAIKFAQPFKNMPALSIVPIAAEVSGGSDGVSFESMRRRVVNGTVRTKTLQTPDDIDAYFEDQGYVTTTLKDGVTDRIFVAHAPVKTSAGAVIGAASIGSLFSLDAVTIKDYDTIVQSGQSTFTILPSTRYRFDPDKGVCVPLTTAERLAIESLTPSAKVDLFNNNIYTLSPYHLHVDIASKYPVSVTYDMNDFGVESQEFVAEKDGVDDQLILNASVLTSYRSKASDTKNTYQLQLKVSRIGMEDVAAVVPEGDQVGKKNMRAFVALKNVDGSDYFAEAKFVSNVDGYDYYTLDIGSDYAFNQSNNDHTVRLKLKDKNGDDQTSYFLLTSEMRVILCCSGDIDHIGDSDSRYLDTDFTGATTLDDLGNYYALGEYRLILKFGSMVNELDQRLNLTYSEATYLKYATTKFLSLDYPKYKTKSDGTLDFGDDPQNPQIQIEYPAGTLTCFTTRQKSDITPNKETVKTLMAFECVKDDGNQVSDSDIGKATTVMNAPVVPKFTIADAAQDLVTGTPLIAGDYEILVEDAAAITDIKSTSRPTDVWVASNKYQENSSGVEVVNKIVVKTLGDLLFNQVLSEAGNVLDGADMRTVVRSVGTFILNESDSPKDTSETTDVLTIGDISSASETEPIAKLYYCYSVEMNGKTVVKSNWKCLAQGLSYADMKAAIEADVTNAYGYVYHGIGHGTSVGETSPVDVTQTFVSFLTTKKLDRGDGVLMSFPALDPIVIGEDNEGWRNNVNKYPWDNLTWYLMESTTVDDKTVVVFTLDSLFTTTFNSGLLNRFCEYTSVQYQLMNGQLQEDLEHPRKIQYLVDMLQIDAKLAETTANKGTDAFQDSITDTLRVHYTNLGNAKNNLFTNTRLLFEPTKSMGYAEFAVGNDKTEELQLDVEVSLKIHVSQTDAGDSTLMTNVEQRIINIIDTKIEGGYLNLTEVASQIMSEIGDTVLHVDVVGINGDPSVQTLKCVDPEVRPHLKHKLMLLSDETTIDWTRGLNLEVVVND